ncbi:MAG: protein translocase subunit SecD, partial [Ignavibacteriales bacterium]|nr:protein translocase subunit SecD [Ignavibacteriales bacterium]
MKDITFRLVITIAFIALCVYLLYPTFQDYQNTKRITEQVELRKAYLLKITPGLSEEKLKTALKSFEDSIKSSDQAFRDARAKRVKLGLDLQGGMRLVLEVNTAKMLEKLPERADEVYKQIIKEASKEASTTDAPIVDIVVRKLKERGIRVSKYFGSVREDEDKIISDLKKQTEDAVVRAMEIIRNRIDQYGVAEPSIQRQGERRIVVELPGVAKEEEARQLLQGTALLEFKLLKDPEVAFKVLQKIDEVIAGNKTADTTETDSTASDSLLAAADTTAKAKDSTVAAKDTGKANKQLSKEEFAKLHPFFTIAMPDQQGRSAELYVAQENKDRVMRMLNRADVRRVVPDNIQFVFSAKPVGNSEDGQGIFLLYSVNKNPELTGGVITNAVGTVDPSTSTPMVSMEMNSEGSTEWARITGANIGKRCAIVLDDAVFSAPVIRNKIAGGRSQIEGMKDMDEAKLLEIVLKAGALPAPVDVMEQRTVGPSLGSDSVNQGANSMLWGYLLVAVFMIVYYQKSGTIAAFGLSLTILFILGVLAGFKATLTLPGIAGMVLTMGMAVDANVLIY